MFTNILHNEHFNNFAAIIRAAYHSKQWQARTGVPVWTLVRNFDQATAPDLGKQMDKADVLDAFTALVTALAAADGRLVYSQDDMDWFISVLDSPSPLVPLNMLKAWFSAYDQMLTPAEVAEQTGTAESTWRNKAAAGEFPGAQKKGKQWLLPVSVLRSRGLISKPAPAYEYRCKYLIPAPLGADINDWQVWFTQPPDGKAPLCPEASKVCDSPCDLLEARYERLRSEVEGAEQP